MSALPMEGGLDLSAIFPGMDAETLRKLMAQFQPNDADKASARSDAFVDGGLALLANSRRGHEMEALGNAGLFGRGTYRSTLNDLTKQRGASIAQAGGAFKLGKEISRLDQQNAMLKGDEPAPAPAAPVPFPHGGTVADALTGDSAGPNAATPAAIAPAPSGASAPPNVTRNYFMQRARDLGVDAPMRLALAADTDPFGKAATILAEASKPHVMSGGQTLYGADGRVRANAPNIDKGMQMGPNGVEAMPGYGAVAAGFAGGVKGAESAADEAAKQRYRTATVTGPDNRQRFGYVDALAGPPPGGAAPASAPAADDPIAGIVPRSEQEAAQLSGMLASRGIGANYIGKGDQWRLGDGHGVPLTQSGVVVGPDPIAVKRQEAAVTSQAAQDTKIAEGGAKDYLDAVQGERAATTNIAKFHQLKNYWGNVHTGPVAPTVLNAKALAAYIAPDLAKKWTGDVPYQQGAEALTRQMALELRNPAGGAGMPGSLSDADRNYLESMVSNAQNDPRAIPLILDARIAVEKRNREIGRIARTYKREHGAIDEGFYAQIADFAAANPLFDKQSVPPPRGESSAAPAVTIRYDKNGRRIQ